MDSSRLASHRRVPIFRRPRQVPRRLFTHSKHTLSLLCTLRLPVSYSGYLTADASLRLTRDKALELRDNVDFQDYVRRAGIPPSRVRQQVARERRRSANT